MHVPRSTALRALAVAALLAGGGLLAAPPASAHDELVGSEPAASSTVTALPTRVVLHFGEPPLAGGSAIVVRDPAGTSATTGTAVVSGSDVSIDLVALTVAGTYTVSWRTVAGDGHPITGTFAFTVPASLLPAPPTATPTPTPTSSGAGAAPSASPTAGSSSSGAVPWLLGALAVLVGAGVVVALLRRRSA